MINTEMKETTKVLSAKEEAKNTTNIKMINIKMMNIIIKLKTRIKKKTSKMTDIENKTTDKNKIIEEVNINATIKVAEEVTDKNSKINKTTKITIKVTVRTTTEMSFLMKKTNSIE